MAQASFVILAIDKTSQAINSATRGLQGLTKSVDVLNSAIAATGIYMAGQVLTRTIMKSIEFGDELAKASIKAGIAGEQMSSLAYAARQSDIDIGSLSIALRKMQIALSEASTGGKGQKEALDALGISLNEIKQLEPDKQFELLADRINALTSPADRARAATDLFGRSGAELLPMFEKGAQGIREARLEAERLGLVLSTDQQKALADADDAVKRLTASWDAFSTKLTAKVAPSLTLILDSLSNATIEDYAKIVGTRGVYLGTLFEKQARKELEKQLKNSEPIGIQSDLALKIALAGEDALASKPPPGYRGNIKPSKTKKDDFISSFRKMAEQANAEAREYAKFQEELSNRLQESAIKLMKDYTINLDEIMLDSNFAEIFKDKLGIMQGYLEVAAMEMSSIFANFLFDPFKNGLRGMLADFSIMIRRMIAQIIANQILISFFTWLGGLGGVTGAIGNALLSGMPGQKANGGPVSGNTPYIVGERGPELFMPSSSGTIVPNHRLGGGVTVAPVYNIDARGATADLQAALPSILKENNRRIFDELDRRYGIGR